MVKTPVELTRYWFEEVWNNKNRAAIGEMLTEDSVHYGLNGPDEKPVRGVVEFEKFFDDFVTVFPDLRVEIEDIISEGDRVAIRYVVTGTQAGDLSFEPAVGRKTRFTGAGMCRFEDGKFAEVWNEVDFGKMAYDLAVGTPDIE